MAADTLQRLLKASPARLLWEYSLPAVVGMLVMSLYNVVDRVFIGQVVGPDAIAGLAITFPVMNLSAAFGVLIGVGASSRISILLGRGNREEAERILGNALVYILLIAGVYLAIFAWQIDPLLRAFGASDRTLPYARDFMLWILPGMLLMNVAFSFNNIMRADGYPVKAMWTMIMSSVINMALVPVFIYWLQLGIKGAAMATDIAMTITAIYVMQHFCRRGNNAGLRFRRGIYRPSLHLLWLIISIGAAPSVVNAASCFINILMNRALVSYGGDTAVAAAGIFVTFTSMLTAIVVGMCQGMQPILGYNYGARRYDRLERTYWLATATATLITFAGFLVGMLFPTYVARIFTTDEGLIRVTAHALRTAMPAFAVVGFQIISTCLFQSIGLAGRSIFLSLTRQVLFLIPLLWLLPRFLGLDGVWNSFWISDLLATAVTAALVWYLLVSLRRNVAVPEVSADGTGC